ncbi:MAG: TolC family protein [Armatimonadetes bacterium]|nr:TolC family protein [Armatimonadota bacterium]
MRRWQPVGLVGLMLVALPWQAWSQSIAPGSGDSRLAPVEGPLTLTPATAARLAVARSTETARAGQDVAAAEGRLMEARSLRGWKVTASGSISKSGPAVSFELPGGEDGQRVTVSPTTTTNVGLEVSKPLYLGARDRYARDAARSGLQAASFGTEATSVAVALRARQAVLAVLRAQQLSVVAQEQLTAAAEHLRIAEAMYNEGTAARFEVIQAQTEVSRSRGAVVQARTAVEQQTATLREVLNLPQDTPVTVEEGVGPEMPPGDVHELMALAMSERPDLKALQAAVRAAEASLRLAAANDRLSVQLVGQANHQTAGALSSSDNWRASVAVVKPLYQGGATEAGVVQARAGLEKAKLDLEKAQQQVALQLTQAMNAVEEAREMLQVATDGEREAEERLRIAQVRFTSGVGLGVEVIDSQAALAAARAAIVNARNDLNLAIFAVRAALGRTDLPEE